MRNEQIFSVHGDAELLARAGHLFESARTEFLCAARDLATWAQPEARTAVAQRMHSGQSPEFVTRKLLSPVALTEEASRAHIRLVLGHGAQVRITDAALPHETIIIDRRVMILAGRDSPAGREYSVTTSKNMIDGVHSLFDAMWHQSTDYDTYLATDTPHLAPESRRILEALSTGLTDATAARQLGVSLRTYRRRVADLLVTLQAASRFQAGLRAGELGLPGR
ncbi:DNA-binding response regulator [Streptomyces sp. col6]|uniref:response regulator transcription factor n=1 Tax=Streptomyces sp. col6 TaxID=2478958 RepID=UPI0011CD84DE|nr:response regulator transcription factor [Streptomyces sp. col6]TXR96082.1 DNA-binding response regulator [Streptomyces sp. col6]